MTTKKSTLSSKADKLSSDVNFLDCAINTDIENTRMIQDLKNSLVAEARLEDRQMDDSWYRAGMGGMHSLEF
jgi:hypothetical protein